MALHKDVRRERAFEAFKHRLEGMSPEQIRKMLQERRIRSPERIELAKARLAQYEKAASGAAGATAGAAAQAEPRAEGDGQDRGGAQAAAAGTAAAAGADVPLARQVGRMLGIGLGIAGIAALAVFAIRR